VVGTTRRPLQRERRASEFSNEVLQAFAFIKMLPPCQRAPPRCGLCPRCIEFGRLDEFLAVSLGGKPWEIPFVSPAGVGATSDARRRWGELDAALEEATDASSAHT
jgi:hypothetical protein